MVLHKIILMLFLVILSSSALAENVISKQEADNIFTMLREKWEETAPLYAYPNWKMKVKKIATGSMVAAFDNSKGYGLSIQPVYLAAKSLPVSLIVGSFYPKGTLSNDFSKVLNEIEADSERDLGYSYRVSAKYLIVSPNIEEVELTLTRKGAK